MITDLMVYQRVCKGDFVAIFMVNKTLFHLQMMIDTVPVLVEFCQLILVSYPSVLTLSLI